MWKRFISWAKREKVLCISALCALITAANLIGLALLLTVAGLY